MGSEVNPVETITLDHVIEVLNDMIRRDHEAVCKLIETRVPCNMALANHPTVQCAQDNNGTSVGLLGVLNGFF